MNTTLTPHSIIHGDACFAYFNKIWGIPRLRFELQLAATGPKSAQRALAPQEIERLRGELDGLKNDVKELTETQHQAAHTIAAMKAAEEDLRRHVPPPYWYSNPATLDLAIAKQPQSAGVAPPPGDRALRIARSAQARGRCASIAGVSAVTTTRADVAIFVPTRFLSCVQ